MEVKQHGTFHLIKQSETPPNILEKAIGSFEDASLKREMAQIREVKLNALKKVVFQLKSLKMPQKVVDMEWNNVVPIPRAFAEAFTSIEKKLVEKERQPFETTNEVILALDTATDILISDQYKRLGSFAQKHGLDDSFCNLHQFSEVGSLFVKIGGTSILDVIQNPNLAPCDYFNWSVETTIAKNPLDRRKLISENKDEVKKDYLSILGCNIDDAHRHGRAICNISPGVFDETIKDSFSEGNSFERDIASKARKLLRQTSFARERLFNTVLNPNDPQFPKLKEAAEYYLKEKSYQMLVAVRLGITTYEKLVFAYRKALKLSKESADNAQFYLMLAESAKETADKILQNVFTNEDTVMFLNGDGNYGVNTIPNVDDFTQINKLTFQITPFQSSQQELSIDVGRINWQNLNLVPPESATIQFSKGGPSKFTISLHYAKDADQADVVFQVNTKKDEFEWNFLEDPNDPQMKDMKNALMLSVQAILLDLQKQAKDKSKKMQEAQEKTLKAHIQTQVKKNNLPPQPYTPREKIEKPELAKPLTPIQKALITLENESTIGLYSNVRRQILLQTEELKETMRKKNISDDNQIRIIEAIQRFNSFGAGKLKPQWLEDNGKPVWELRVGKFRVLVKEKSEENGSSSSNENGVHLFEISEVGHRKDIFKKTKLIRT